MVTAENEPGNFPENQACTLTAISPWRQGWATYHTNSISNLPQTMNNFQHNTDVMKQQLFFIFQKSK